LSGTVRASLPSTVFDDLIKRIAAVFGSKFQDFYAGADAKVFRDEWSAALADFKPIELERGLAQMESQKFVPTLGEFAQWCRPCLDPEWAFREAEHALAQRDRGQVGDWSHPAVWRAASALGMEVRSGDYAKVRVRWAYELKYELAQGWGEQPPPPPLRVTNQTKTRPPNEEERAKIAKLLRKGGDDAAQDA
jgi:hypothetical protein